MLYLDQRRLKAAIANSSLSKLMFALAAIEGHIWESQGTWPSIAKKWNNELIEAFTAKAMLLVTGIDDIVKVLGTSSHPAIRNSLIKAYAAKTRDIGNIIILLNQLGGNAKRSISPESRQELQETEAFLIVRSKELAAANWASLTVDSIKLLAEKVQDASGDGSASRAAEDIIIDLAIPQVKHDVPAALEVATAFRLLSARHRFLLAFLNAYGLANSRQARKITDAIDSSSFYGNEVAKKILAIAEETRLELSDNHRQQLERLSIEQKSGFTGILDMMDGEIGSLFAEVFSDLGLGKMHGMPGMMGMMSILDGDLHHVQRATPFDSLFDDLMPGMAGGMPTVLRGGFHRDEDELSDTEALMKLNRLLGGLLFEGKDSVSSPFPFFPHGILHGETHNHPGAMTDKCTMCPGLPHCPDEKAQMVREAMGMPSMGHTRGRQGRTIDITGTDEEKLRQLEEHLQRICTEGTVDMTVINGMPAELFMILNLDMFSPETRTIIEAALQNKEQLH
jgi:hypothetical protein